MGSPPACTYSGLLLNSNGSRDLNLKGAEHFWPQSINQHASRAMLHSQQRDYSCFFYFILVYTLQCLIISISLSNFIYSSSCKGFSFHIFVSVVTACLKWFVCILHGWKARWYCWFAFFSELFAMVFIHICLVFLSLCWKYCLFLFLLFAMQILWAFFFYFLAGESLWF